MAFQNKVNISLSALSVKASPSNMLSPALKKQSNFLQVNLFSKLANNDKLTSDKYKKCLEKNLCLYCGAENHKLDSYPKKQTTVTPKGCNTLVATNSSTAISKKLLENKEQFSELYID